MNGVTRLFVRIQSKLTGTDATDVGRRVGRARNKRGSARKSADLKRRDAPPRRSAPRLPRPSEAPSRIFLIAAASSSGSGSVSFCPPAHLARGLSYEFARSPAGSVCPDWCD